MSSKQRSSAIFTALPPIHELAAWASEYDAVSLDLGAGDGRFARERAVASPRTGVIAIDTCGGNARAQLRRAPDNLRFIVADACSLPAGLFELAEEITINFPWGSLLRAVLDDDEAMMNALHQRSFAVRVNAGALAEAGYGYDAGVARLRLILDRAADRRLLVRHLDRDDLRQIPATWAKRLAFGRDPRAIELKSAGPIAASAAD